MNTTSVAARAGLVSKFLSVLCLAVFWLLPLSPLFALAAVAATRHSVGWPRLTAKAGAILTVLWTAMCAAVLLNIALARILRGSWSF